MRIHERPRCVAVSGRSAAAMRITAALLLFVVFVPSPLEASIPVFPFPFSIMAVPGAVPVAPGKTLSQAAGLDPWAIYYFRKTSHDLTGFKFQTDGFWITAASTARLAPDGLHVAYDTDRGVTVVDLVGERVGEFPEGSRFRWNHDGSKLAVLNLAYPGARPERLTVWNLRTEEKDVIASEALDLEWGPRDTLFLSKGGDVSVYDMKNRRFTHSRHRGVSVSPDSRYALQRDPSGHGPYRVFHSRSGRDLTTCTLDALGAVTVDLEGPAFWVQNNDLGRVLCVSRTGTWTADQGHASYWGGRVGIIDVQTSELLLTVPGIGIGPSADGRSVWVYDGWDLTLVPLDPPIQRVVQDRVRSSEPRPEDQKFRLWPSPPPAPSEVTLRVKWRELRWGAKDIPWQERLVIVHDGDFVPTPLSVRGPGDCREAVRVTRINGSNAIEMTVTPPHYSVSVPGFEGRSLAQFEVGEAPVILTSRYGFEVQISVVPQLKRGLRREPRSGSISR